MNNYPIIPNYKQ